MLRNALFSCDTAGGTGFRLRGTQVSRLEGFSDAVFGFAVTLLVVSLEVPASFQDLLDRLKGVVAFGACFALLIWVWYLHHRFFRRYGLTDATTMILNTILLFVVLLYVYPLKFLFTVFIATLTGLGPAAAFSTSLRLSPDELRLLFVIFGLGFAAMIGVFALLHAHAYRRRVELELNAIERHDTIAGMVEGGAIAAIGVLSCLLACVLPPRWIPFAGWLYILVGPTAAAVGVTMGARRRRMERAGS